MRKACPRKFTNRKPVAIKEYANGYTCGCIIPDEDAPPTGAPGDVLKVCSFADHRQDPCEDDGHRMLVAEHKWMTPDEAIADALVLLNLASAWMNGVSFSSIMQDRKRYEKFKKLGEE